MSDGLFDVESPDPYVARCVAALRKVEGWPSEPGRDEALVIDLARKYPDLNVLTELERWSAWMSRNSKEVDPKGGALRVRNWFRQGRQFRAAGRQAAQTRARVGAEVARRAVRGASPSAAADLAAEAHEGIREW